MPAASAVHTRPTAAHRMSRRAKLRRALEFAGHGLFWFTVGVLFWAAFLAAAWGAAGLVVRIYEAFGGHPIH